MMVRKNRVMVVSPTSLDVREIRYFRSKLIGSGLVLGVVLIAGLFTINWIGDDFLGLGIGQMSMLMNENRILKSQIHDLAADLAAVEHTLQNLSERGNELRLAVDLSRVDDDTREAAIGGSQRVMPGSFLSGEVNGALADAQSLVEKLSREVKLQQSSYEEITRRLEYNKSLFTHMPAIKPMAGTFSPRSFGMRNHPVVHVYKMHTGIDIINDVGTPVYASGDGQVSFVGRMQSGYGIYIEVDHGFGYTTLYGHLSQTFVSIGQQVKRGTFIAKSGRTGLVSGPHLHYEVRHNGALQNPMDYFLDDIDAAHYRTVIAQTNN